MGAFCACSHSTGSFLQLVSLRAGWSHHEEPLVQPVLLPVSVQSSGAGCAPGLRARHRDGAGGL